MGRAEAGTGASVAVRNGSHARAWFASRVPYTPAIELGGRQILAFHAALALFYGQVSVARVRAAAAVKMDPAPSAPVLALPASR